MMALSNSRKESLSDNLEQETRSPEELPREQQIDILPDFNQVKISDQNTMNLESQAGVLHLDTVPKESDTAVLTDNTFPVPTSPEIISRPPFVKQRSHPSLVLKVSNDSYVSVTVNESKMPLQKTKSVVTKGGRVIRNVCMNNSVKYDIDTAYNKYGSDFSNYNNVFQSNSIKQGERRPSLKRDGQVRRASRSERTNSERSISTSSSEEKSAKESQAN